LGTEGDDRRRWLQAGRALGRLLLNAMALGASGLPARGAAALPSGRRPVSEVFRFAG
jgi:hypothetical protein